ncbi:hypothetical protein [Streptomyces sp. NPDC055243]
MNEHVTAEPVQSALFPLAAVQTEGYAKPEPRGAQAEVTDDTEEEAA